MQPDLQDAAPPRSADAQGYPCKECGGKTRMVPGMNALRCDHCGYVELIERGAKSIVEHDYDRALAESQTEPVERLMIGAREIECKSCGARVVVDKAATRCAFCDSSIVVEVPPGQVLLMPESVLPFQIPLNDAQTKYQAWLASRWFAPNGLAKRAKKLPIDGIYIPYWTFDASTNTSYSGSRGDYYYTTHSYTDSQGRVQTRSVRHTSWSSASGEVSRSFDDTLICASKSLPQKYANDLEPWDLSQLAPFDGRYLAGFIAEHYAIDLPGGFELAEDKMESVISQDITNDIGGDEQRIDSMNINYQHRTFKHMLLPLWLSAFRYNDKVYRVMINANSGEVTGERPYSWIKIALAVLAGLALIAVAIWFFHYREAGGAPMAENPY